MAIVAVTFKVVPEGPEVDIETIKKEIKDKIKEVKEIEEKPIAFGLKFLEVLIVFEDRPGGTDDIENKLSDISGVASVEAGDITLI